MLTDTFDVEHIMKRYRSRFRRRWWVFRPRMEYHVFADAVYWTDEFPVNIQRDLENAFRVVLHHRTSLLTGKQGRFPKAWDLAVRYFPRWIGFKQERCTFNPELADRIARIRRVSNRCIERSFAEFGRLP